MAIIKTNAQYGLTGTVQTANVADDAITLAKMASGTDGNVITYDASGNPAVVAVGTSGHFLKSQGAGSVPVFAAAAAGENAPYFSASITSNQTLVHDTTTRISFDRADVDSASGFNTTYNKYTIPSGQGGYWHIGYSVNIGVGANDKLQSAYIYPKKGGSDFPSFNSRHQGVAFTRQDGNPLRSVSLNKSFIANYSASDYIDIRCTLGHSDGGSNVGAAGEYYSNFWGYRLAQ